MGLFSIEREDSHLRISTSVGEIEWDARRGGQITGFAIRDESAIHPLIEAGDCWPDMQFHPIGKQPVRLRDARASIRMLRESSETCEFQMSAALGDGALVVEQQFEVHAEGALFCEFAVRVAAGRAFRLASAEMSFAAQLRRAKRARWGYFSRTPVYKRDPTCIHVMPEARLYLPLQEEAEIRQLLALLSLDLGWEPALFFSNHLELLLEDWTALGDGPVEETRTCVQYREGTWRVNWRLYDGPGRELLENYSYRNRWGIIFGVARTESGRDADPRRRNNLIGARIAHCGAPGVRKGPYWPWCVMPATQSFEIPPMYFQGYPEVELVDAAALEGVDVMILHSIWMANPGSNNEPPAEYRPGDEEWLRTFVDRCHKHGMRVGLYMRGTEMYAMYSSFFEEFLEKDRDGLYVDWSAPLAMGWAKCSPLHFSAHNYFHFTRALRRRVGEEGFLIGHSALHTLLALLPFDAALCGESAVHRQTMLTAPEACAYYAVLGGCGGLLLSGDLGWAEKGVERATAFCAALGISRHAPLRSQRPFAGSSAFMRPIWNLLRQIGRPVKLFSPAVGAPVARCSAEDVFCVAYRDSAGKTLLMVTNLGKEKDVEITLDLARLGLPRSARLSPVPEASPACTVSGSRVRLGRLQQFEIRGLAAAPR